MKRRSFLRNSVLAGLGVTGSTGLTAGQVARSEGPVKQARNIIFLVYDGFSWEDLAVARHFAQRHQGQTLALERLFSLGTAGSMMTHSLTSVVTDSSAASTVWATGRRTVNGYVSMFPNGQRLSTILELVKEQGRRTGLITTTRVTHATPAGFIAHVPDRDLEDKIAEQYLDSQADVILGGGARHFDPQMRKDSRDLYADFVDRGYEVILQSEELEDVSGTRVLGTFTASHLPFEIDRVNQGVASPSLAELARKGLQMLSASPNGFVVQIEAGRIDHANHNNDPSAMVWDVLAADETLEVVLNFADRNPDTLVIFGSDHGTGGGAVYGVGNDYLASSRSFDRIARRKASFDFVLQKLGSSPGRLEVTDAVMEFLGVGLSAEQADWVVDAVQGTPRLPHPVAFHEQPGNSLGWVVATGEDFARPTHLNIHYSAGQHTAGPVPIALYGAGTSDTQLGLVDSSEVFGWMTRALGIEFENPSMSEAEALTMLENPGESTGTVG